MLRGLITVPGVVLRRMGLRLSSSTTSTYNPREFMSKSVVDIMMNAAIKERDAKTVLMVASVAGKSNPNHIDRKALESGIQIALETGYFHSALDLRATAVEFGVQISYGTRMTLLKECVEHFEWKVASDVLISLIDNSSSPPSSTSSSSYHGNIQDMSLSIEEKPTGRIAVQILGGLAQNRENLPAQLNLLEALIKSRDLELCSRISLGKVRRIARAYSYFAVKPTFLRNLKGLTVDEKAKAEAKLRKHKEQSHRAFLTLNHATGVAIRDGFKPNLLYATALGLLQVGEVSSDGTEWSFHYLSGLLRSYSEEVEDSGSLMELLDCITRALSVENALRSKTLIILQTLTQELLANTNKSNMLSSSGAFYGPRECGRIFSLYWKLAHELENHSLRVVDLEAMKSVSQKSPPNMNFDCAFGNTLGVDIDLQNASENTPIYVRTCNNKSGRNDAVTDLSIIRSVYSELEGFLYQKRNKQSLNYVRKTYDRYDKGSYRRRMVRVLCDELCQSDLSHRVVMKLNSLPGKILPWDLSLNLEESKTFSMHLAYMSHERTPNMRALADILKDDARREWTTTESYSYKEEDGQDLEEIRPFSKSKLPIYYSWSGKATIPGQRPLRPRGRWSRRIEGVPLYWSVLLRWFDSLTSDTLCAAVNSAKGDIIARHSSSSWGLLVLDVLLERLVDAEAALADDQSDKENEELVVRIRKECGNWTQAVAVMSLVRNDPYSLIEALRAVKLAGLGPNGELSASIFEVGAKTVWQARRRDAFPQSQFATLVSEYFALLQGNYPLESRLAGAYLTPLAQALAWSAPNSYKLSLVLDQIYLDANLNPSLNSSPSPVSDNKLSSTPEEVQSSPSLLSPSSTFISSVECTVLALSVLYYIRGKSRGWCITTPLYERSEFLDLSDATVVLDTVRSALVYPNSTTGLFTNDFCLEFSKLWGISNSVDIYSEIEMKENHRALALLLLSYLNGDGRSRLESMYGKSRKHRSTTDSMNYNKGNPKFNFHSVADNNDSDSTNNDMHYNHHTIPTIHDKSPEANFALACLYIASSLCAEESNGDCRLAFDLLYNLRQTMFHQQRVF